MGRVVASLAVDAPLVAATVDELAGKTWRGRVFGRENSGNNILALQQCISTRLVFQPRIRDERPCEGTSRTVSPGLYFLGHDFIFREQLEG